jgi:nucleotide-binding universal stress UspA family protein
MKEAVEGGYDLLAVGRRGHGASKRLIGSTASRLAHGADVPVLIV